MTKLNEKRDELLAKYLDDQDNIGELNSRHMDDRGQAWANGFDAAVAEIMPMLEKMAGELKSYVDCYEGEKSSGQRLLDKYKRWKEGMK